MAAPRPGASRSLPATSPAPDYAWRLLVRIAYARWAAIVLGLSAAALSRQPLAERTTLVAMALVAAAYNTGIAMHRRLPRRLADRLVMASVAGDFAWVTVAALLTVSHADWTAMVGYISVALESGLLFGWTGALSSLVAATGALVLLHLGAAGFGRGGDTSDMIFESGTILAAALLAGAAASELRTQQHELIAQATSLASHARTDHLTGLANAHAFDEAVARLAGRRFGVLLIDVDGMRETNDVYGHLAGDELLHSVARVLTGVRETGDLAARLAEDKFALLLPHADRERTGGVAEQVRAAMHGVAVSRGRLRVSVGCAMHEADGDPTVAVARADDALVAAKVGGGDRVVVQYGAEGAGRFRLRAAVESILADDRGIYSVYQRIVHLDDRRTVAWEALSRPHGWPPGTGVEALFLTAHRMGRGRDLDWRCRRNALWEASRLVGPLFVNINIAGLVDPVHGVDQMLLACTWAGRAPSEVVLELSERDAMPDMRRLRHVVAEYRAAGFRFALDDIGEGHTSLELMLAARPEFLKLARQLLQSSRRDHASRSATRGLVGFAHDIGSTVIAEGVEDEQDCDLCLSLHVDMGQGWLFGRPLPPAALRTSS